MQFSRTDKKLIYPSKMLNETITNTANDLNISLVKGTTNTTSVFGPYGDAKGIYERIPSDIKVIAEEMEGYAVCLTAEKLGADASVLLSVTDSPYINGVVSNEDRQNSLNSMIKLALESIIK